MELGSAAARFVAIGGYHPLGFSRLGDYSRERLGISGRELQSFASVASRLDELPLVAGAFARGEISWSQARLLCAGLSRADARPPGGRCAVADAVDEESDCTEGEPRVRFSVPCPARVTLLWRRAIELARRMLGSQAPIWQAAEAIVAEASSSVPIDPEKVAPAPPPPPPRLSPLGRDRREAASEGKPDPDRDLSSLDAFALDAEMRELVGLLQSIDTDLGAVLRRVVDLRIYRALRFDSFDLYVRERLGISPAKARALVMVERRMREAPALAEAYRSGALSWVRALAILPVIEDASHAAAWVTRAQEVMVRRLQDDVEWALDMRDACGRPTAPPEHDAELSKPDLQTCARPDDEVLDRRVTFFGPASVVALFEAGVSALTSSRERRWRGLERLLLHAIAEWEAQPRHRDPIFARDGWRCTTPGCSGRMSLHDHHIEYRSHGGGNEQWNRTAVCAAHHLHAVHLNVIGASGRAPYDIVWKLGLRPGRAPLLPLHGERYLSVL